MKIALIVLGFLGVLHANPLNHDLGDEINVETFGTFVENKPEPLSNFEGKLHATLATPRPPQIHHNAVKTQGPFSGRLVNVLVNENGEQKTVQENRIEYNVNGAAKTVVDDFEGSP